MSDPTPKPKKLTPKQRAFIDMYFSCSMNASAAVRRLGYKNRPNTAAAQLMSNNVIKAEIDRICRENAMPASEAIARLTLQARGDIADVVNVDGKLNLKKARSRGVTSLIKSITHTTTTFKGVETTTLKVDLYDAQAALHLIGKIHKLFTDRVQVDDWRSQAIQDIKDGRLDYPTVSGLFDETLAQELFRAAGVVVVASNDISSE